MLLGLDRMTTPQSELEQVEPGQRWTPSCFLCPAHFTAVLHGGAAHLPSYLKVAVGPWGTGQESGPLVKTATRRPLLLVVFSPIT